MADNPAARPANIVPEIPTHNPGLIGPYGTSRLYNQSFDNLAYGILQHGIVFGLAFGLRWFQPRKALDLYYLSTLFSLTAIAAAIVFLWDRNPITVLKFNFFLEHEAIEYLIAFKVVLAPRLVARHPGWTLLLCWMVLSLVTVAVSLTDHYKHGADIVVWGAFSSDTALAAAGVKLVWTWATHKEVVEPFSRRTREIRKRLLRVDAMAGLAMVAHGVATMPVPILYTLVIYDNLSPDWYSYAWFAVFVAFLPAIGLPRGAFPDIEWAYHAEALGGSANSSKTTHAVEELPKAL
ncbi:hypothetical protein MPH_02709 [Macrophomina phaseolina MS6]|uniref:Uncharacterized protein n=1 Tax=Macrophomina phaseolina (strain MS6) TaxID=1126212 RepID=K2SC65_MACPH|nr:hypothetical protein MPH_02709 [Macrophomina phaseolina MS6]